MTVEECEGMIQIPEVLVERIVTQLTSTPLQEARDLVEELQNLVHDMFSEGVSRDVIAGAFLVVGGHFGQKVPSPSVSFVLDAFGKVCFWISSSESPWGCSMQEACVLE